MGNGYTQAQKCLLGSCKDMVGIMRLLSNSVQLGFGEGKKMVATKVLSGEEVKAAIEQEVGRKRK